MGPPHIGFFGRLGSGNLGNDASFEVALDHVRSAYPDAVLDAMCSGPDQVETRYGLPATHLHWLHSPRRRTRNRAVTVVLSALRIALGLLIDGWRTVTWVRRHDVVIVPGMGVLETTTVQRPWQEPYSMFLLAVSGRLTGTRVALVGVGASVTRPGPTRWLLTRAARAAHYVSYRDRYSRHAMNTMGVRRRLEPVFPDLVFAMTPASPGPGRAGVVGVGLMDYRGTADENAQAEVIHEAYLSGMKRFVRWLLATGYEVRLLVGDQDDEPDAYAVLADARSGRPGGAPPPIEFRPTRSTSELIDQIGQVETVVATRFHNVLLALACARPTLAIAYGRKHQALMSRMGVETYSQDIRNLDVEQLQEQFLALRAAAEQVAQTLTGHALAARDSVRDQFDELDRQLFVPALSAAATNRSP